MVLSPQAERAWKLGTAIISSMAAFHTVFRVDYGDQEHVFTDLQKWYNRKVDDILLGGLNSSTNLNEERTNVQQNENLQNQLPNMNNNDAKP